MNVYDVKSLDRRLKSNSIQIIDQSNHDSRFSVGASLDQSQCDHGSPLISKKLNSNTGLDFLRAETFGSSHRRRIIESPPHNALSIKQVPSNLPSLYADVPNYEVDDDPISSSLHSRSIDKKCFKRHSKRLRPRLAPEEEDRTFDFCSQSASVSSQKSSISHLRLSDVPSIDENNLDDKFSHIGNKYQVKKYDLRKRGQKIYDFHRLHRSTPKKKYFNRKYSLLEPRKRGRPPKLKNLRKSPRNLQQVSYNERDTTGTDFFEDCMVDEGSESEQKSLVHRGSFNRKSNRIPESCKNFSTSEDEDDHSLELVKQLNLYDHQLNEEDSKVSIADRIAGMEDYLRQLKEMVLFPLLYPEMYNNFGMKPPRGVIFYGPPGTGKTMLARLLAESCSTGSKKVSFFIRNGSECLSKWIGEAEKNLRALFKQASEQQPSIIFFDEIDGLAPERSARQEQSHVSLVATLLALMDGLHDRGNVVVIGATNRIDSIDRALRRPGRFDREFAFTLPSETIRRRILDIYTTKWNPLPDSLLLDILASDTEGFSGADLRALCSEAALNGIRRTCPSMYDPIAPPPPTETVIQAISQIKINESDFRRALKAVLPLEIKMKASNVKYRDLDSFIYENSIENTANLILKLAGISSNEDENLDENIKNFHNIKNVPTEQVTDDCVAAQSGVLCLNFKGKSTASLSHMEGLCLAASKRLESFTQGEIIIIDPIKQILVSKQSEENFYSYLTEIVSSKRRKNQKLRVIFWPGLSALLQSESQNAVPALYITFIKAWIERNFSSGLQDISCILVSIEGFGESVVCLRDLANAAGLRVSSAELRLSWSLDGIFKWVQKIISSNISLQIIGSIEEHEKITTSMGKLWSTIESQKTFDDVDQIMKNIKRHVELVAAQYLPPTETQSEPPFDICQVIDKFMHDYPSSID